MLVVFDLDFTLWDAGGTWCDHTSPPYERVNGEIRDGEDRRITLYPDVREIIQSLDHQGIDLGLASRTHSPETALHLLDLFGVGQFFPYRQIFPGSKTTHFNNLRKETGLPFGRMFFFDDESRNIEEVGRLGVRTRWVRNGLGWPDMDIIGKM